MALFKSNGIVFRSIKYSETSLILDIFTREKGMRSFIVSGVRKAKAKSKASMYQHLNILDLVAYDKDDKLARIKECKIAHYYNRIAFDVVRSSIGLFLLEVCKNTIKEKEENVELYDFIQDRLILLDSDRPLNLSLFPIKFLLELSQYIGFLPYNNYDSTNPYFDLNNGRFIPEMTEKYICNQEVSQCIAEINGVDITELKALKFPKELRNQT
ncbi:MAG: DNA repair protein RecO, partial [Bacteroidota bacterium]